MNRRWPDGPPPTTAGTGVRTVREAVGDVIDKATTWRAEIDADHPAVDRAAGVLRTHVQCLDVYPTHEPAYIQCECGHRSANDDDEAREYGHYRHMAEQLAVAGLLSSP